MKTKVIFKIATFPPFEADEQPIKELIALFPDEEENGFILSYMNVGQHSQAHKDFLNSPDAEFEQYKDLYFELTNLVGYDLDVLNPGFNLQIAKFTAGQCKKLTEADRDKLANEILIAREENERVLYFIKEYQRKNEYNPKFLDEYNAKFNAEFKEFLNSGNFSQKTIELFTN